jgi:nucleoside-diphosphate kinase
MVFHGVFMSIERTLAIIKPDAVQNGHVGEVLTVLESNGFAIKCSRMAKLGPELIKGFYREHLGKPFFPALEAYMLEGPVMLLVLEREGAIAQWRALMGATDPAKAAPGTLRCLFGKDITHNAVHGSDSPSSAEREISFFFNAFELG